jgi:hypothetical protein
MIEMMFGVAFFVCGFGMAFVIFYREIKLGVQVKKEVRLKNKEAKGNEYNVGS